MPTDQLYNETQLLHLLRLNNEAAFSAIYNQYWETLYAIAYNRTRNIQVAQDIVQEVFTSLWKNRHKTEISSLKNYLASAVKYMTLAYLRESTKIIPVKEEMGWQVTDDKTIDQQMDYKSLLHMVQEHTDKLPEKCRLIFKYSREQGLTINEIADQLRISPRTVETQLSKALRVLRKSIKKRFIHFFSWIM